MEVSPQKTYLNNSTHAVVWYTHICQTNIDLTYAQEGQYIIFGPHRRRSLQGPQPLPMSLPLPLPESAAADLDAQAAPAQALVTPITISRISMLTLYLLLLCNSAFLEKKTRPLPSNNPEIQQTLLRMLFVLS